MNTNKNIYNYMEMLEVSNINHITGQNFILDELYDFAEFINMLAEAYQVKEVVKLYHDFLWWADRYEKTTEGLTLEQMQELSYGPKEEDWLAEDFMALKIRVEDMAAELVLYSENPFFSSVRR